MNKAFEALRLKIETIVKQGDSLVKELESFGWEDKRPKRVRAKTERTSPLLANLDMETVTEIPATVRVPSEFVRKYQKWYAACLALVEINMPSRRDELASPHESTKSTKKREQSSILDNLADDYITFEQQVAISRGIRQIQAIANSIPAYLEGRLHDIELQVAQVYIGDQLLEAEALLKAGYVRAAGAVAGMLLERHLKTLSDHHQPPIKYPKTAGISKINDALRDAGVYDVLQWRKVQWLGDVRNSCDHANKTEPKKGDVADLIGEVRKFVALFVI